MNKFKRDLDEFVGESQRFKEPMKQKVLFEMKREKQSLNRFGSFKYAAVLLLLLTISTFFLVLNLDEKDMDSTGTAGTPEELPALTDPDTLAEIEIFTEYEEPLEVIDFRSDAMDRGNHDFTEHPLVINPEAYAEKKVARGDVIAFDGPSFASIGRIVGMPGEEVEVVDGQIYIDNQKLDTFYGRAHRVGASSNEEYMKWFEANNSAESTTTGMEEIFQMDIAKITLSIDEIYVVGDDWFRSKQEIVKVDQIEAEVLGYYVK